jgi:hypothetical protein
MLIAAGESPAQIALRAIGPVILLGYLLARWRALRLAEGPRTKSRHL